METINEDVEAAEVINRLDQRLSLEQTDIDGKRSVVTYKGYGSRHLFDIESFVRDIENGWLGGFTEETTRYAKVKKIRTLRLGKKYYAKIDDWLDRYSDEYRYSSRVEVFYDACKTLRLIDGFYRFQFGDPAGTDFDSGVRYLEFFNALIEQVRERCQSREFKERERLRLLNAKRNEAKVLALEEAMFSRVTGRSRWLILSLTLRYKPQYRRWITPEIIQQHRERFFAARRFHKLMSGIKNYAWTIEQGEKTGLHLHVIIFYSADSNHDEFIAKQIGEYWVKVVTDGKGEYWNSNDRRLRKRYQTHGHGDGVGQINRGDTEKREALRKNLVYLAKARQYLMCVSAERIRTFDMGHVPKRLKAGQPRGTESVAHAGGYVDVGQLIAASEIDLVSEDGVEAVEPVVLDT